MMLTRSYHPSTRWILLMLISVGLSVSSHANAALRLLSIARSDNLLREIDSTDGSTLSSIPITFPGATVTGGTGLAVHPFTGEIWALLKLSDPSARQLVIIDPTTGVATDVGDTGDKFAGLAFDDAGTLYGVTGDGASIPETLFTLNQADATPTLFLALGNGEDGETIAFNPSDGLMYHASGIGGGEGEPSAPAISNQAATVFEHIDLDTLDITDIPVSGDTYDEATALTYDASTGLFLMASLEGSLYTLTSAGIVTFIGALSYTSKGLAFAELDQPLPVELARFNATISRGGINLHWRTESETNNVGFRIYRSDTRSGRFRQIGFVPGRGSTAVVHEYTFLDKEAEPGKTYYYFLQDISIAGHTEQSQIVSIGFQPSSGMDATVFKPIAPPIEVLPTRLVLYQNYPNPFNPETWIPYQLVTDANVQVRIYDISGTLIRRLGMGHQPGGYYVDRERAAYWNGTDENGEQVSSGIYFYQLRAGDYSAVKRMVIVK